MSTTGQDFRAQLRRQLGFLRVSATAFDNGDKEEAIRIGATLRVLFHQTLASTSLLTHLGAASTLVRSDAPDRVKQNDALGGRKIVGEVFWSLMVITGDGKLQPRLEPGVPHRLIEADRWWNEVFAVIDLEEYTRKDVVLWAANKDGGAHVDSTLPARYQALKASGATGSFEAPDGSLIGVEDAHYTVLRTMAFEVLNSPALANLAK